VKRFSEHVVRKIAVHEVVRQRAGHQRQVCQCPGCLAVIAKSRHQVPVRAPALALIRIIVRWSDQMKKILAVLFTLVAMSAWSSAYAVEPDEIMADPVKEARARELSRELRCMVCQNQSIDDSGAPLARDLRLLVRERIAAGDSDAQVIDFLVARYGEFVLLKPRLEPRTLLLWLLPPLVLAGGGLALWMHGRRRPGSAVAEATGTLTPDEAARLATLMADESSTEKPA
jgi:cytochrome c-type biogenesis protein CcmH